MNIDVYQDMVINLFYTVQMGLTESEATGLWTYQPQE